MLGWLAKLRKEGGPYDPLRLVNTRVVGSFPAGDGLVHVVSDIDKTYLETQFESLIGMAKIVFEKASDKVTVRGAREIMRALRWGLPQSDHENEGPRPLHFVSSSPTQLRPVLEEKLMLDYLDWSSDTFKNQAYNLRMRRMDQLKQHTAYKSAAILGLVGQAGKGSSFYLLGDNAEQDTYVYLGVALVCEGLLSAGAYVTYLEQAGVESHVAKALVDRLPRTLWKKDGDVGEPFCRVGGILIRHISGYHTILEPPYTDGVIWFHNYFEAGLSLFASGVIPARQLWQFIRAFHNHHRVSSSAITTGLKAARESSSSDVFKEEVDRVSQKWQELVRDAAARRSLRSGTPAATGKPEWDGEGQVIYPALHKSPCDGMKHMSEEAILSVAAQWLGKLSALKEKTQK